MEMPMLEILKPRASPKRKTKLPATERKQHTVMPAVLGPKMVLVLEEKIVPTNIYHLLKTKGEASRKVKVIADHRRRSPEEEAHLLVPRQAAKEGLDDHHPVKKAKICADSGQRKLVQKAMIAIFDINPFAEMSKLGVASSVKNADGYIPEKEQQYQFSLLMLYNKKFHFENKI